MTTRKLSFYTQTNIIEMYSIHLMSTSAATITSIQKIKTNI